jgi:hypothetical protein
MSTKIGHVDMALELLAAPVLCRVEAVMCNHPSYAILLLDKRAVVDDNATRMSLPLAPLALPSYQTAVTTFERRCILTYIVPVLIGCCLMQ